MTKPTAARAAQPTDDLRRRAAGARDAAGRFIRRTAPAQPYASAAEPDPALAAATVFRASWNALGEVLNAEAPDDMTAELQDAQGAAYDRLCAVRPTTPEGFRALAQCWAMMLQGERGSEPGLTISDAAADSLIAGAGVCMPPSSTFDRADPTHALISTHRYAYAVWDCLSAVWNEMVPDDPGYAEAMAASDEPGRREVAAYDALFTARPTSLAGAAALASYLSDAVRRTRVDAEPSDGERALSTIAEALRRLAPTAVAPSHPDAALFALGAEFMAAWVAEEADGDEPEYRACSRIARQIMRAPAATVAGYGIKALLLARLDSDASGPHAPIEAHGPADSWWNVLRQVQQGAALLAAASDIEMPISPPADPVTVIPVSDVERARPCAPVRPDLSELSIVQLARLYSVLVRVEEVMGSAENAPCFWNDDRSRTGAGAIINWEADRLQSLAADVAKEIHRRQPADDHEAEERANTLLFHTVVTGGVAEHPELVAEINATWGA